MPLPSDGEAAPRPPYHHAMVAGGLGGVCGDMLMHSLDTVKTRQQGDLHMPPRYSSFGQSYWKILQQEGAGRGLYGGWAPALLGSLCGNAVFFLGYEFSKRTLIDLGVRPSVAYFAGGLLGDLVASVLYVPSEVLKTRLQLQGRHNNPFFKTSYNYRGLGDATRTMIAQEGVGSLFHGYRATLMRDLPFAGLQFFFYERSRDWWQRRVKRRDIGWVGELTTGACAGGAAGIITCPLDVVKTRLQTQGTKPLARPAEPPPSAPAAPASAIPVTAKQPSGVPPRSAANSRPPIHATSAAASARRAASSSPRTGPSPAAGKTTGPTGLGSPPTNLVPPETPPPALNQQHLRPISTSSPSTHLPKLGAARLETSSVFTGLKIIYRTEGLGGWFRGVGPRTVWTSVQSGCMLFLYQSLLRVLEPRLPSNGPGELPL